MARTSLSQQQVVRAGIVPTYSAADAVNGNQFLNTDEKAVLHVKNGGGAPITVTIPTPITIDGLAVADLAVTVNNASEKLIGPFPRSYYNQTDGMVYIDYSSGTSVTVAVLRV